MSPLQDFFTFLGCLITIGRVAMEFDIYKNLVFMNTKKFGVRKVKQLLSNCLVTTKFDISAVPKVVEGSPRT